MSYILSGREVKALEKIESESSYIKGSYAPKRTFAPGVGDVTLSRLAELGLIEHGLSNHYHGEYGYRITQDGERCLYGLTVAEVLALPEGTKHQTPRVKMWPLK